MESSQKIVSRPLFSLGLICASYFLLCTMYAVQLPLVMDEFAFACHAERLLHEIPYRDYQPYKTLLGSYLHAPVLFLVADTWWGVIAVKIFHAAIIAVCLFLAGKHLLGKFSASLVLSVILALCLHSTFLERSAAVRVDMLTALCGAYSLLLGLDSRYRLAAFWGGVSFLASQKGIYFIIAFAAAHIALFLYSRNKRDLVGLWESAFFGLLPIALYILFFASFSSFRQVFTTVFMQNYDVAFSQLYAPEQIRIFWWQTLSRNPIFYGLASLAIVFGPALAFLKKEQLREQVFVWVYSAVVLLLCIWHKQPWPYFFVMLLPTCAISIIYFLNQIEMRSERFTVVVAAGLVIGASGLAAMRLPVVLTRNADLQRATVRLAENMLSDGDVYLAGVAMLRHRKQPMELHWLDMTRLRQLEGDSSKALAALKESPPKLIIWNYRITNLPKPLKNWLRERYQLFGANVFTPAVMFPTGSSTITVTKTGEYRVMMPRGASFQVKEDVYQSGSQLYFTKGKHIIQASQGGRLAIFPPSKDYKKWTRYKGGALFGNAYSF